MYKISGVKPTTELVAFWSMLTGRSFFDNMSEPVPIDIPAEDVGCGSSMCFHSKRAIDYSIHLYLFTVLIEQLGLFSLPKIISSRLANGPQCAQFAKSI
jgi:hypothetical protein